MCPLDAVYGGQYDLSICNIHAPVVIQVVHLPVSVVVDEDVVGIAIHMAAERRPSPRIPAAGVVLRSSKPAHYPDAPNVGAVLLEVSQDELVLVDDFHIHDNVFRPDVGLIVGKEILKLYVLRELCVLILGGHLDEPARRTIHHTRPNLSRRRPASDVVKAEPAAPLFARRAKSDDAEAGERIDRARSVESDLPDADLLRRFESRRRFGYAAI